MWCLGLLHISQQDAVPSFKKVQWWHCHDSPCLLLLPSLALSPQATLRQVAVGQMLQTLLLLCITGVSSLAWTVGDVLTMYIY